MTPQSRGPGGLARPLGSESLPMTMQADIVTMTTEAALASGLFDLPDAFGMVRIPVTIIVTIPDHLLGPAS